MRLERVLGTNGIFVRTESGMKNPIGNKFFSPGELVCVDDNVVYGNENKVHSFTYTSNPMIEVFLSFEQEYLYGTPSTLNETIEINSCDYLSNLKQLDVCKNTKNYNVFNDYYSSISLVYSENIVSIVYTYPEKINITKVNNDKKEFIELNCIQDDNGKMHWCNVFLDKNNDINILCVIDSLNKNMCKIVCCKSSGIIETIYDYTPIINSYMYNIQNNYENTTFPDIIYLKNEYYIVLLFGDVEFSSGELELKGETKIEVLETKIVSSSSYTVGCCDISGGNFALVELNVSVRRNVTKFRFANSKIIMTWDDNKTTYFGYTQDGQRVITGRVGGTKGTRPLAFSMEANETIVFKKNNSIEFIIKQREAKTVDQFVIKTNSGNYTSEIITYINNNPIESIYYKETGVELVYKIKDSEWNLIGYTASISYILDNCYLTNGIYNIKIPREVWRYIYNSGLYNICEIVECDEYILFQINDSYSDDIMPIYCYIKNTGEIINLGWLKKLSNKIKINIKDYKKLLATLLAE